MLEKTKEIIASNSKGFWIADDLFTIEETTNATEALFTSLWSAVWWDEGYHWKGETPEDRVSFYSRFRDNSRDLILCTKDGSPMGTIRLVKNEGAGLPAFTEDVFKDKIEEQWKKRKSVELTLLTVLPEWRSLQHLTSFMLWREGYRYAKGQSLDQIVFITDERLLGIFKKIGFPLSEIVSPKEYEGGMCGVYAIDLREVERELRRVNPDLFEWFTHGVII